jgi:hypothetical protein
MEDLPEMGRGELRGRTAAEIDCGVGWEECGVRSATQFHFLAEGIYVVVHHLMVGGGVEGAVDAPALTEWNMNIQTCHFS